MPDGTVNGTPDDQSEYTILQRSTVDVGRIKVQGVATCLYLCMDPCGAVYGSKEFTDDCVFNENMEQHNYNTYSSTYNSNSRRKYYLALNRHGEPRKLQIPPTRSLGKLATYTNAITEAVPQERVEQLIAKNFGANRIKHGIRQLCDTGKPLIELIDSKNFKAHPKCNPNSSSSSSSNSILCFSNI
uniref:Fibroblast growth factor n=1 Tax=Musca domestica TaxID=7370 RepID=T1PIP8_MUSDO